MGHRLKAFSIHLGVCCAVFGGLLAVFVLWLYPQPYFSLDGGWAGLRIALAVDLVAGPLLTAVVARPGKPRRELVRDLAVIATLQGVALVGGLWTVYRERPAMVVFSDGSFYPVKKAEAEQMGGRAAELLRRSPFTPSYGLIRLPEDPDEAAAIRRDALRSRRALFLRGDLLEPLDASTLPALAERCAEKPASAALAKEREKAVTALLGRRAAGTEYVVAPLSGRFGKAYLAFRKPDARVAAWVRVEP